LFVYSNPAFKAKEYTKTWGQYTVYIYKRKREGEKRTTAIYSFFVRRKNVKTKDKEGKKHRI